MLLGRRDADLNTRDYVTTMLRSIATSTLSRSPVPFQLHRVAVVHALFADGRADGGPCEYWYPFVAIVGPPAHTRPVVHVPVVPPGRQASQEVMSDSSDDDFDLGDM